MAEAGLAAPSQAVSTGRLAAVGRRLAATPLLPALVAAVLGLFRIGDKPLWLDETTAVAIARLPTAEMLAHLWRVELHAAPYYIALHPWLALGDSPAAIRSLSVVFGVLAVVATWAIGRRYGVGLAAALLLAIAPIFVEFEQEARGYTLLMAGSALSTLLLLRLLERPGRWRAGAYVVVAAGLIYVHPLASLVVFAHALWFALGAEPRWRWRLLALYLPIVAGWLPMIRFALLNRDRIAWVPPTTLDNTLDALATVGGGLVLAPLVAVLLAVQLRRDPLALWLIVPIVGTIVASLVIQPMLQPRYLLAVVPAAAIILARNPRPLLVGLALICLVGVWNWYEKADAKDDWSQISAFVGERLEPGDGIVFAPDYLRAGFGFHLRAGESIWPPLEWSVSDLRHGPLEEALARLEAAPRVWLVRGHAADAPAELEAALAQLSATDQRDFSGPHHVRVTLLIRADR